MTFKRIILSEEINMGRKSDLLLCGIGNKIIYEKSIGDTITMNKTTICFEETRQRNFNVWNKKCESS